MVVLKLEVGITADPATLAFYRANAPQYTRDFAQKPSRHLDAFLDRLKAGARVMELGCGAGCDAARMMERGFDVDATDGTPEMVAKANEHYGVSARVMRFDELMADDDYDAVWANACLLHVARSDLPPLLTAIRRALRPCGWHFASYKLGNGEGRDLLGRLHNFPDPQWLEDSYCNAGFAIEGVEIFPGQGADGTPRDWMALTTRRPS